MIVRCTICVAICATLIPEIGLAQTSRSRTQGGQDIPTRKAPAARAPVSSARTQGQPAGVPARTASRTRVAPPPVSPELDQLLKQWEVASTRITRLQGKHQRRVYDMVFKVEKISNGVFYHEVPDKGRIDIEPVNVPAGSKSARTDDKGNQFALVGDMREKWICDGKRIIEMDEKNKAANIIPIPPRGQGENIMNGPLPFLFGMKAEKAKQRYQLSLISDQVNPESGIREIQIRAFPRWQQDGQNWKEARIILEHPRFLPKAIKLIDSAGTKETVFKFTDLQENKNLRLFGIFTKDPFRPNLREYKINTTVPGKTPDKPTISLAADEQVVPDVTTWPMKDARAKLQQAGFVVPAQPLRGGPAPMPNLVYKVRTTSPAPMKVLKKGSTIKLVVYEKQQTASRK